MKLFNLIAAAALLASSSLAYGVECAPYVAIHQSGHTGSETKSGFVDPKGNFVQNGNILVNGKIIRRSPRHYNYMSGPDTPEFQAACSRLALDLVKSACLQDPGASFDVSVDLIGSKRIPFGYESFGNIQGSDQGTRAAKDRHGFIRCSKNGKPMKQLTEAQKAKAREKSDKKKARNAAKDAKKHAKCLKKKAQGKQSYKCGNNGGGSRAIPNANGAGVANDNVRFAEKVPELGNYGRNLYDIPVSVFTNPSLKLDAYLK